MNRLIVIALAAVAAIALPSSFAAASEVTASEISAMSKKPKAALAEVTFATHLHCEDCVKKIQENVAFEKGVKDLSVSLEKQTVWIKYDPSKTDEAKLEAAIEELGYEAEKTAEEPGQDA